MESKESNNKIRIVDDTVSFQIQIIDSIKTDIDSISIIIDKIEIIKRNITILIVFLLAMGAFPFLYFYNTTVLDYGRVLYASIGVLTFISIFYSLLISQTGRRFINRTNRLLEKAKTKIEELSVKEIQNKKIEGLKDVDEIKEIKANADAKIEEFENTKKFLDVGYYLIITVFFLFVSILYSLFNDTTMKIISYLFFIGGFCISGAMVLLWRSFPKILKVLQKQLGEEL